MKHKLSDEKLELNEDLQGLQFYKLDVKARYLQETVLFIIIMCNEQNTLGDAEKLTNEGKAEIVPRGCLLSGRICIHIKMGLKINWTELNRCTSNQMDFIKHLQDSTHHVS